MGLKYYKPTTPSRRNMSVVDPSELTRSNPQKSLVRGKGSTGGRNNQGKMTVRFRGGGVKRSYRVVDFRRDKLDIPAKIASIEYDPNRSGRIALLNYADGEKRYILAPVGLKVGTTVIASKKNAPFEPGNAMPISIIPPGITIHNIELTPGRGGALVRSAGQQAIIRAKEGKYAQVRLPSGEVRLVNLKCMATIGQVSNVDHMKITLGKAGKKTVFRKTSTYTWCGHESS